MTRNDFEVVAEILAGILKGRGEGGTTTLDQMIEVAVPILRRTNPNFDGARFERRIAQLGAKDAV